MKMRGSRAGRWSAALALVGLIVVGRTTEARADEAAATEEPGVVVSGVEEFPRGEPQVHVLWKLSRGLQNVAFGLPAEVVKNTFDEGMKGDTFFAFGTGLTEGLLVGIGKGFWRIGAGVCDIFTFPWSGLAPWYHPRHLQLYPF
jgi:putative exosortase-associated protein (TIGR04073 family)